MSEGGRDGGREGLRRMAGESKVGKERRGEARGQRRGQHVIEGTSVCVWGSRSVIEGLNMIVTTAPNAHKLWVLGIRGPRNEQTGGGE